MISIQKEIRTAEDLQTLLLSVCESYRAAVADGAQYAIELDKSITPPHREALRRVAGQISVEAVGAGGTLPAIRSSVRNLLRDYKERAEQYLGDLRARLEEHGNALTTLLDALTSDSQDQEKRLRVEMRHLGELSSVSTLVEMRTGVLALKGRLETCIEELERQNRVTVAGLQSEIQALQRQVEQLSSPPAEGGPSGVRERVEAETAAGNSFFMLFVRLRNLDSIRARFGADLTARVVQCADQTAEQSPGQEYDGGHVAGRRALRSDRRSGERRGQTGTTTRTTGFPADTCSRRENGSSKSPRRSQPPVSIGDVTRRRRRTSARIAEVLTVLG